MIRTKSGAAALSIVSNSILIALKLAAGAITGSIAIITEAIHSAIDLMASVVAFVSVRKADEPADAEHPYGHEYVFEARCEGTLLREPRGSGGFGYDPAFVPDETGHDDERTMAELSPEEKNAISHRGKATRMLARHLGLEAGAGP